MASGPQLGIKQIAESQQLVLMLMSLMGACPTPWLINDELGEVATVPAPIGPLFRFLRYDVKLEPEWLRDELGVSPEAETLRRARRLDDAGSMPFLREVGGRAADKQVLPEHWAT